MIGALTLTAAAAAGITHTSTGESDTFFVLAPICIGASLAMVFARNAVHAALALIAAFFCFAVFYGLEDAPFLAFVQIFVYAGAIMVLFLFVLMLVGVDSADSLIETIKGQRAASVVFLVAFTALLTGAIGNAVSHVSAVGLSSADGDTQNVQGIAKLLFTTYVFPFELTSALVIVAAVGAMVLAHKERTEPRQTQADLMRERFRGPLNADAAHSGPGVFAETDRADQPALLPSGAPDNASVLPEGHDVEGGEG